MDRFSGLIGVLFVWLIAWSAKRLQQAGKATKHSAPQATSMETVPVPQQAKVAVPEQRLRDRPATDRLDPRTKGFDEFVTSEHAEHQQAEPRHARSQGQAKQRQQPAMQPVHKPREVIPTVSASPVVQAIIAAEILSRSGARSGPISCRRRIN